MRQAIHLKGVIMRSARLSVLLVILCLPAASVVAAPTPAAECSALKAQIVHLQQSIAEMKGELAHCHGCNTQTLNNAIKGANEEIGQDQIKIKYGCKPPQPPKPPGLPPATDTGPAGPDNHFTVTAIEVTQAVQDLNNSVTLIAGKQTWARVYVNKTVDDATIAMKGSLSVNIKTTGIGVTSDAIVNVNAKTTTQDQRRDATKSFNFLIPDEYTKPGTVRISLSGFIDPTGHNEYYNCTNCADVKVNATFLATPPLRLRLVDMPYQFVPTAGASPQTSAPRAIDYVLLKSWLGRAYPVPNLEISHTVVPYDQDNAVQTNLDCGVANKRLAALRASDISSGVDDRTHYLGLVGNGLMKMRGCSAVPPSPDPSAVGSLPTGAPTDAHRPGDSQNDMDASFADYYGGHELAHTFGRKHPGFCGSNTHDDPSFPYPNGQISDGSEDSFFGFDIGDAANSIPRVVLPGDTTKDNMTYCPQPRWFSPYQYDGIRQQLLGENPGFQSGAPSAKPRTPPKPIARARTVPLIHVVAEVNLEKHSGSFYSVFPVNRGTVNNDTQSKAALVLIDAKGRELLRQPVTLQHFSDPSEDKAAAQQSETSLINADLPTRDGIARIRLLLDNATLAEFEVLGTPPGPPRDLRLERGRREAAQRGSESSRLTWSGSDGDSYLVEVSADNIHWSTIAVGSKQPYIALSATDADARFARVTATDGVHRSATVNIALPLK
jgi:hypothetical protein